MVSNQPVIDYDPMGLAGNGCTTISGPNEVASFTMTSSSSPFYRWVMNSFIYGSATLPTPIPGVGIDIHYCACICGLEERSYKRTIRCRKMRKVESCSFSGFCPDNPVSLLVPSEWWEGSSKDELKKSGKYYDRRYLYPGGTSSFDCSFNCVTACNRLNASLIPPTPVPVTPDQLNRSCAAEAVSRGL